MFITGLGNVRGIGPMTKIGMIGLMTKIGMNDSIVRVRDLDDQWLSLLIPALLRGDLITFGISKSNNRRLRRRLLRLNPHLASKK